MESQNDRLQKSIKCQLIDFLLKFNQQSINHSRDINNTSQNETKSSPTPHQKYLLTFDISKTNFRVCIA